MHTEGAIPPVHEPDVRSIFDRLNDHQLVGFVTAVDDQSTAKDGSADIKPIKGANIAPCVTNCSAQMSECARDIVQFTVEADGEGCSRNSCHKALRLRIQMRQNMTIYEIACSYRESICSPHQRTHPFAEYRPRIDSCGLLRTPNWTCCPCPD